MVELEPTFTVCSPMVSVLATICRFFWSRGHADDNWELGIVAV